MVIKCHKTPLIYSVILIIPAGLLSTAIFFTLNLTFVSKIWGTFGSSRSKLHWDPTTNDTSAVERWFHSEGLGSISRTAGFNGILFGRKTVEGLIFEYFEWTLSWWLMDNSVDDRWWYMMIYFRNLMFQILMKVLRCFWVFGKRWVFAKWRNRKWLKPGLVAGVASRCTLVACRQRRQRRFGFPAENVDLADLEIGERWRRFKRSPGRIWGRQRWRSRKRSLRTSHWRWSTGVVGIFTGLETKKTIENWRMKVMKVMKAQNMFFVLFFLFLRFRRVLSVVSPRSDNSSVWPWLKAGHVCRHRWFVTSHASVIVALCWTCQGTSLNLAFWNVYWILVSLFGPLQNFGRCVFNFHRFHGMSNVLTQKSAVNMPKSWEKLFVQAETWCFVAQSCQSHRCSMRIWYSQAYTIPPEESIGILPKFILFQVEILHQCMLKIWFRDSLKEISSKTEKYIEILTPFANLRIGCFCTNSTSSIGIWRTMKDGDWRSSRCPIWRCKVLFEVEVMSLSRSMEATLEGHQKKIPRLSG